VLNPGKFSPLSLSTNDSVIVVATS
jgi:hypothetical protein